MGSPGLSMVILLKGTQDAVAERRRLVQEIRDARDRLNDTKPAFQSAKAEFDEAVKAFKMRLATVKTEQERKKRSDKRSIAQRAGVPYQHLDDVWVSQQGDVYNIYFGGVGKPNGPGHGHYVMDQNGNVTYRRDPFDQHGGQNFTDAQQDYHDLIDAEAGSGGEFGFWCKFRGFNAFAESNTNKQGRLKIDIYYGPNGPFGPGHHHAVAYRETPHTFVYDEYRS